LKVENGYFGFPPSYNGYLTEILLPDNLPKKQACACFGSL
jgi:hypothetical protein